MLPSATHFGVLASAEALGLVVARPTMPLRKRLLGKTGGGALGGTGADTMMAIFSLMIMVLTRETSLLRHARLSSSLFLGPRKPLSEIQSLWIPVWSRASIEIAPLVTDSESIDWQSDAGHADVPKIGKVAKPSESCWPR